MLVHLIVWRESAEAQTKLGKLIQESNPTFANPFQGAHLSAILHGMKGEVNLRQRLLLLDGANGIVNVLGLIERLLIVLHDGQEAVCD